jgi:hypothetical protein
MEPNTTDQQKQQQQIDRDRVRDRERTENDPNVKRQHDAPERTTNEVFPPGKPDGSNS